MTAAPLTTWQTVRLPFWLAGLQIRSAADPRHFMSEVSVRDVMANLYVNRREKDVRQGKAFKGTSYAAYQQELGRLGAAQAFGVMASIRQYDSVIEGFFKHAVVHPNTCAYIVMRDSHVQHIKKIELLNDSKVCVIWHR